MKFVITFILTIFLLNINGHTQNIKSNADPHIQKGLFICRLADNIIYSYPDEEGEYPMYKLYSLNLANNKKTLIDRSITLNCWVKTSDSTLVFAISNRLYTWNSNTNLKGPFLHSTIFNNIIAIGYNQDLRKIVVFNIDRKNTLTLKVFDEFNNNIFNQKVKLNPLELEGVSPKIESTKSFFIFSVQDKLYIIDLSEVIPNLKLISNKCDGFALNEDNSILFYKFIFDERTTGYLTILGKLTTDTIDKKLDEKIYNCSKSNLFYAQINGKNIPAYLVCNIFYMFSKFKWDVSSDFIIYEDEKLKVSLLRTEGVVDENSFEWILQD